MMNKMSKNIFFLGKGGTGKTTMAALSAFALAERGEKVALFSMDPAHNLFDVFQINSSKNSVKIRGGFIIEELDIQYWIKTYLRSIEEKIARSYQYVTTLSLEKNFKTIRFSPGLEEYAMHYAFEAVNKTYRDYTYRLFDMPPTALALKFLNLPKLVLVWLNQLIELRKKILEKQNIISTVQLGEKIETDDKILSQLYKMQNDNKQIVEDLQIDQKSGVYIVLNEDELSISESMNILGVTSEIGITINGILINKYQDFVNKPEFEKKFAKLPLHFFPLAKIALIGMSRLREYLNNNIQFTDFVIEMMVHK